MSINLEVVCTDPQCNVLNHPESTVRLIGEILPFVLGQYGIEGNDCLLTVTQELHLEFDCSI